MMNEKQKRKAQLFGGLSLIGVSGLGYLLSFIFISFYGTEEDGIIARSRANESERISDSISRHHFRGVSEFLIIFSSILLFIGIILVLIRLANDFKNKKAD